jgi:hypothetical protein
MDIHQVLSDASAVISIIASIISLVFLIAVQKRQPTVSMAQKKGGV